jgi:eukaryotic-like serine/threonine-protein kinase
MDDAWDRSSPMAAEADHHLLFGLIALQVGLIDQAQLVAAFQALVRDKGRPLADHLADRAGLDADGRSAIAAMVALHIKKHGADAEKSLAAIPARRSTRERLAALGDPELTGTVTRLATGSTDPDAEVTVSYGDRTSRAAAAVVNPTGDGQRFKVLRPHAKGGLGAVFVALDSELHREVALKQILDSHADDPVSRRRFVLEAEITGGLEHPGIVPVYGLGTYSDGRPYYAMRFIGGNSLKEAIDRFHKDESHRREPGRRSLELRRLLRRFIDVCNAIDYAHSRGVLHRDLKPSNIILGKHGETLVVDWGLAKPLGRSDPQSDAGERTLLPSSGSSSEETLPGAALGTPGYMSPEQARGDINRVGPRSDIYSLGATLYCLLTGRAPFEADDVASLLRKVQWGEYAAPRELDLSIDRALEAVCLKAMTFAPEGRYATSRALADDIERWTAGQPVAAWHEPLSRRAVRWARRSQAALAALAAAALVTLAGSAYVRSVQTKAKADLTSANTREKQRFELAMNAIKVFHGEVTGHPQLRQKQFDGLRASLLTKAAEFYGRMEADLLQPRPDRESLTALAKAYDDLGGLTQKIGDHTKALLAHRRALAVRRTLASEPDADVARRLDLVRSLIATGWSERSTGDLAAASASGDEARSMAKEIGTQGGDAEAVQGLLAAAIRLIAVVLAETGDPSGALASYRDALAILQKLAHAKPGAIQVQTELADSLHEVGRLLVQAGRPDESIAYFDRQEQILTQVANHDSSVPDYLRSLARGQMNAAVVLRRLGRFAEARARCQRAVAQCQLLLSAHPDVPEYRLALAEGLLRSGQAHQADADLAGAASEWRRAVALVESSAVMTGELAFIDAACRASISSLAGTAGARLSADEREAEANRAMALLRQAAGMGYRDPKSFRAETALDPLRARDDFRLLLLDLAMPANATAPN